MKTSISHIPKEKQEEISKVIEIIKQTSHKNIKAEIIILFGSYARGDFVVRDIVSEGGTTRVYESDFDIMVITKKPTQEKNIRLSMEINEKISKDKSIESNFSIIIEDIYHVNKMLEESRYFYIDIKNEGIMLYDSKKYELKDSKELPNKRRKEIQKEDFDIWFQDAEIFLGHYKMDVNNKNYKIGAFSLHQATERYITAYLLVMTGYKAKTHDLKILFEKMIEQEAKFSKIFDLTNQTEEHHFELLRKAYIEARYSKTYKITKKELLYIEKKISPMIKLIEKLCKQEIEK